MTLHLPRRQVPRACDLGQVVPQLAALRCYEGVVDLPLAKAAALDPDRVARLPGEQGRAAQEVRTGPHLWTQGLYSTNLPHV